jgi:HD-like signal output (HDOD) protein
MSSARISQELDQARHSGPLRDIIIPPCPELLVALKAATATAEPDMVEIDRIAGADVAMSAALIRQANSPLYALEQRVHAVGQALTVIGLKPAVELLTGFLLRRALPTHSPVLAHFWENSTRRALACEHIGTRLYSLEKGLAHSFGLFCHVGIPVMMQGVRGYASTLTEALARRDRTFTQTENANHRTDHAVVGAIVAKTWHLPLEVAVAIRLHHDFTCLGDAAFPDVVRQLVALGLIADHLVARHEGATDSREWLAHGTACLAHLDVTSDEVELWVDELHPQFEAVTLGD